MLTFSRRRLSLVLGGAALATAGIMMTGTSVQAQPWEHSPHDWSLTDAQIGQARHALMLMATQSAPNAGPAAARLTGAWPANLTSGRSFGTDRGTANVAMGTPGAAPSSDTRPVVCVEGRGTFTTANTPRPPGAPAQTFTYAVTCFDPTTGDVLDTGYDNKPITTHFASTRNLDLATPIN